MRTSCWKHKFALQPCNFSDNYLHVLFLSQSLSATVPLYQGAKVSRPRLFVFYFAVVGVSAPSYFTIECEFKKTQQHRPAKCQNGCPKSTSNKSNMAAVARLMVDDLHIQAFSFVWNSSENFPQRALHSQAGCKMGMVPIS